MRMVMIGAGLLAASVGFALVAAIVAAIAAGPSIAGGERAAMIAGGFDLLAGLAAISVFALASGKLGGLARVLAISAFAILELVVLAGVFLVTLVLLNR